MKMDVFLECKNGSEAGMGGSTLQGVYYSLYKPRIGFVVPWKTPPLILTKQNHVKTNEHSIIP